MTWPRVLAANPLRFVNLSTVSVPVEVQKGSVSLSALELLFDQVPDTVFFAKDKAGRYTAVNATLIERCGFRDKLDLIGRRVNEVFPSDLAAGFAAQDEAVINQGQSVTNRLELHWYARRRSGWCLTTKLPIKDDAGRITGIIGISRDLPINREGIPAGLADALRYLETHCSEEITPGLLARKAGLSAPQFARLITRVFQATPSQMIAKARLSRGMELLQQTKQSVAQIALDCGYYDHSAFTRAFRQAIGVTPTEYRSRSGTSH